MGSLNADGIPVVSKKELSVVSQGQRLSITSGVKYTGLGNDLTGVSAFPLLERSSSELGTQPSLSGVYDSVTNQGEVLKHSNSANDTTSNRYVGGVAPTSGNQPEINLKSVSQLGIRHLGGRVVEGNADTDTVNVRNKNTNFRS